tara:strand:+ start:124 stop:438 length:315 start_codon:yes stop_codon:yes gene_type:complete
MVKKFIKVNLIITAFIFLTGFIPLTVLFGPATTMITSGNIYKAGLQMAIDQGIQKKTGKNSLTLVKEEIEKNNRNKDLNKKLRLLVEERIKIARKKIEFQNLNQ